MLRIFYRLDRLDNIEANLVAEAANRLGVGEFQFFRLAHEEWFGDTADPKQLEPAFLGYMLRDHVPHYVRQYARNVIDRDESGLLDTEAARFHRFDAGAPPPEARFAGWYIVAFVALITAAFIGLTVLTYQPKMADGEICRFPPCPHVQ